MLQADYCNAITDIDLVAKSSTRKGISLSEKNFSCLRIFDSKSHETRNLGGNNQDKKIKKKQENLEENIYHPFAKKYTKKVKTLFCHVKVEKSWKKRQTLFFINITQLENEIRSYVALSVI